MFKTKSLFLSIIACCFVTTANADIIDITDMADGTVYGESAWSPPTITITGSATDDDGYRFAYLDRGDAGLDACKDLSGAARIGLFAVSGVESHSEPEPGKLTLLGIGLLGIGARRQMKSKS